MSPEIIQMSGFTTASDIWSVGCTVIELVRARRPLLAAADVGAFRIVHDQYLPLPAGISPELTDFLMACFTRDERSAVGVRLRAPLARARRRGEAQPPESVLERLDAARLGARVGRRWRWAR